MTVGNETAPARRKSARIWLLCASLLTATCLTAQVASAHTRTSHSKLTHHVASHHVTHSTSTRAIGTHTALKHSVGHKIAGTTSRHFSHTQIAYGRHSSRIRLAHEYGHRFIRYASAQYRRSYLQCVPYAREVSHIDLSGNAFLWWAEAAGRYARGNTPQEGAVLNFRSIGRMPLGHVAVVTGVLDDRTVLVTQANWVRGTITNDVTVTDVSPSNDWTQVQVQLGDGAKMGAAYPTYGFIYNQPDSGTIIAANTSAQTNEVAEAPRPATVATDAPNRNLQ